MVDEYIHVSPYSRALFVLGLNEGASFQQAQSAYKSLLKKWHPDRYVNDEKERQVAEQKSKEVTEAFEQLKKHKFSNSKQIQYDNPYKDETQKREEKLSELPITIDIIKD